MIVAVPAFQHSPMFGQMASSQTVLRRCSRTLRRISANPGPVAIRARNQDGLRSYVRVDPERDLLMPFLMAVNPASVRYFCPLLTIGMPLNLFTNRTACPAFIVRPVIFARRQHH